MKLKGGSKGKFSTRRMALTPRWRKTRPESRPPRHLTPFERLTLHAARHEPAAPPAGPEAPIPLLPHARNLPPALMAERLIAWSRGVLRGSISALTGLSSKLPQSGPLGTVCRILASPWTGLVGGLRSAFSPVTAEGDRQRGTMAFHGPPREVSAPAGPDMEEGKAHAIVAAALAEVPDKGDPTLPADLSALATLLSEPSPTDDFRASDLVRDCFAPQGSVGLQSRALLGVAQRLSREFGLPTRLPLTTDRAWRMLDPITFEDEMAAQLAAIHAFISDWQKTQQTFLVLEFGEISLIEWLFESLHPRRHADLLFEVMNFKVLSNRRQGILRRIPHRVRKFVKDAGGGHDAVLYAAGTHAYLNRLVTSHGFTPIVETAATCLEEVEKVLEKLKPAALPGPAGDGDGQALARITPVKMPASELADRAIAAAQDAGLRSAPPVAPQPLAIQPLPPRPQPSGQDAELPSRPAQVPALATPPQAVEGVRPAVVRLLPKHIRAGAVVTIPSRSAGRIPLGRMFSTDGAAGTAVPAISVRSEQTRPGGRPSRLPGPIDAVIPPGLPHLGLPAPTVEAAQAAPALPAPQPPVIVQRPAVQASVAQAQPAQPPTGRVNPALPGKPAPAVAPQPQTETKPAPAARVAVIKPAAPKPPPAPQAPAAAMAPPPAQSLVPAAVADAARPVERGDNVTKLTMVQKRRLPITQALKRQSVMRVLRGEDAEAIAQAIGINRAKLDEWVDKFIAAGAGALSTSRKRKAEELTVDTLRAKLAEVLATAQMIEQVMEASLPRRPMMLAPPQETTSETPPRRSRKKQV